MTNYNGWTNWDTWNANLWLTNVEGSYAAVLAASDANGVEQAFRDIFVSESGEAIDDIVPSDVNWQEIYDSLHEGE